MNNLMNQFKKMSPLDKSYTVGIIVLVVVLGFNILGTIRIFVDEISDQVFAPSSYSILSSISNQNYTDLMRRSDQAAIKEFRDNPEALEGCYVGKYYRARLFATAFAHDANKQAMYQEQADEAASHVSVFAKCLEDIDAFFAKE